MRNLLSKYYIHFPNISQVTHLVISKPSHFQYSAGDYVFIQIPDLAAFEWHPFSISSAPEEEGNILSFDFTEFCNHCLIVCVITPSNWKIGLPLPGELWLHIRSLGNWTNKLNNFYKDGKNLDKSKVAPLKDVEGTIQRRQSKRERMRPPDKSTIVDHRKVIRRIVIHVYKFSRIIEHLHYVAK